MVVNKAKLFLFTYIFVAMTVIDPEKKATVKGHFQKVSLIRPTSDFYLYRRLASDLMLVFDLSKLGVLYH